MFPDYYNGRLSRRRELFNDLAPNVVCIIIGALAALHPLIPLNPWCVYLAFSSALYGVVVNLCDGYKNTKAIHAAGVAWLGLCALMFAIMPGCATNPADTLAAVDERIAQAAAAEVEARRAGDEAAAAAFAKAGGELRTSRGGLAAAIVAQPSPAENAAAAAGTAAAGALGGPFGQALAVAAGLIVPIVQQIRIRRREAAAASLVRAFDLLRAKAPPVADAMKENRSMLREAMTPDALRLVEANRAT
jgi:hypothetical protein